MSETAKTADATKRAVGQRAKSGQATIDMAGKISKEALSEAAQMAQRSLQIRHTY